MRAQSVLDTIGGTPHVRLSRLFGSRVDVYLPDGVAPLVSLGQSIIAGETVLADLDSTEGARQGEIR